MTVSIIHNSPRDVMTMAQMASVILTIIWTQTNNVAVVEEVNLPVQDIPVLNMST